MSEEEKRYCSSCGNELHWDEVEKLKNGEMIYCEACGKDLQFGTAEEDIEDETDERIADVLEEQKEDAMEEAEDAMEDAEDVIEEVEDAMEEEQEAQQELKEWTKELQDAVESESVKVQQKIRKHIEKARYKAGKARKKADQLRQKVKSAQKKAARARAKAEKVRINFSLPKEMKEDITGWAKKLNWTVSQLLRNVFSKLEDEIGKPLQELGKMNDIKISELGKDIERIVKESGVEKLGKFFKKTFNGDENKVQFQTDRIKELGKKQELDKERMKKRVKGLIKIQKSLPVDKFAQTLNISIEEAENLIFEMGSEDIDCTLEDGICKFDTDLDKVISVLFDIIDKM